MVCEVNTPVLDGPRRAFLELELYRQTVEARDFIVLVTELELLKEEIARLKIAASSVKAHIPIVRILPIPKPQITRISDALRTANITPVICSYSVL